MEKWYSKLSSILFGNRKKELQQMEEEHKKTMQKMKEEHEKEMQRLAAEHQKTMEQLRLNHENNMRNLKGAAPRPKTGNKGRGMKKFYVNTIYSNQVPGLAPLDEDFKYVGMFSACDIKEAKPVNGHYTDTRYLKTTMHAVAVYQNEGYYCPDRGYYRHFGQLGAFVSKQPVRVNMYFDEIRVMTCYDTDVIEAESVEEAIEKFKNKKWRALWLDRDKPPICEKDDPFLIGQQKQREEWERKHGKIERFKMRDEVIKKYNLDPYTSPWAVDKLVDKEWQKRRERERKNKENNRER